MHLAVLLCFCATLAVTVLACISDVKSMRIPNIYSLAITGAFAVAYAVSPDSFGKLWEHLGALAMIFVITYLMFMAGMMGGGDSKLGSALALWVGLKAVVVYVFWMALMGGVLGVLSLVLKKKKPFKAPRAGSWMALVQEGKNAVPYGIAISFGAWMALWQNGFITHQLDEVLRIIH